MGSLSGTRRTGSVPREYHQLWTVVEGGRGLQRFADGSQIERDYLAGETKYLKHTRNTPLIHDLENVGRSLLGFVTVELPTGHPPRSPRPSRHLKNTST